MPPPPDHPEDFQRPGTPTDNARTSADLRARPGRRTSDAALLWKWAVVGSVRRHFCRFSDPWVRNTTDLVVRRTRGSGMRHPPATLDRVRFRSKQPSPRQRRVPDLCAFCERGATGGERKLPGESRWFELVALVPGIREHTQPETVLGGIATRSRTENAECPVCAPRVNRCSAERECLRGCTENSDVAGRAHGRESLTDLSRDAPVCAIRDEYDANRAQPTTAREEGRRVVQEER